jgi:hypothetical protein
MIPVIVLTCNQYRFVWEPWHYCWKENFSDKLGPYYMATATFPPSLPGIETILTGTSDWTENARRAVEEVNADRFLLLLDDFFFRPLAKEFDFSKVPDGPIVGLHLDSPLYRSKIIGKACGSYKLKQFEPESNYHTSLQPTVWEKDTFLGLLRRDESPWTFELEGSKRAAGEGICRKFVDVGWYTHAVKRGTWLNEGVELATACGWKR